MKNDHEVLLRALGVAVRELRERKRPGYSQEELGVEASMDRSYWGALERGEHDPRISTMWRVAAALKVSPECLMKAIHRHHKGRSRSG